MTLRRAKRATLLAATLLPTLAACDGLVPEDAPSNARVVAEIQDGAAETLQLIVSNDFLIVLDELTGNQDPQFVSADTVDLSADFDQSYRLDPNDARLFVRLANGEDVVESVRLRVFLDGETDYDASANLGNGGFLEYLYRFNQPTLAR